jgi:integrase
MKFNIKKPQKAYPLVGTLYRRTASGKYVNADVSKSGPFYYRCKGRDGKYCCLNLETEDRNQAVLKANWLFYALSQFEGEEQPQKIKIDQIWDIYEKNDRAISAASMDDYKQIFNRWRKKLPKSIEYADEITLEMCEQYTDDVAREKVSGNRDSRVLKGIWDVVFRGKDNPWKTGIKPQTKEKRPEDKSRALTLDEARRFRATILKEAEEWPTKDKLARSNVLDRETLLELYDAVAFAWYYGQRVGSLCSLNWRDFESPDWFYHVPPKTKRKIVDPLTLPIMPEIAEIVQRRRAESKSEWVFPRLHEQYNKRGKVIEREHSYEMRRSANRTGQAELARDIKKLFKKAGIADNRSGRASMHGFRKSCTTFLTNTTEKDSLICSILGWSNKDMIRLYGRGQGMDQKRDLLTKAIPPLSEQVPEPAQSVDHTEIERIIDEL